jgi:2-polyprenyl-3-methyl-5-hydroxy-6-metoxy-1,4-benzoquinol methylase
MCDYLHSSQGTPSACPDGAAQPHHLCLWPSVATFLPNLKRMQILDAGCGNGFFSGQLAALGHEMTALDISESGIAHIRDAHANVRAEVRSVYDSLDDLVPDGGFDLVLSSEAIEHLYAPHDFLLNIARALRLGGWIILTTPYHGYFTSLALSLISGWDSHLSVQWEGSHIIFFSQPTLSECLSRPAFPNMTVRNAGRMGLLWKSIVVRAHLDATL